MSRYYRKDQYTTQDEQSGRVNTETYYVGAFETIKTDNSLTHQYTIGNMLVREDVYTGKMTRKLMIRDHLGSVLATSELNDDNTQAFISQTFRYDPFGQQFALQESGFAAFTGYLRHGFTGHEMLNELNIIHMNGRIYDPTIGRFLQADPFIQAPTNSQSYNRYSYVLNNPLSYTDPSGYFFNKLFKGLFTDKLFKFANKVLGDFAPIAAIAISIVNPLAGYGFWGAVATGAIAGGVATGSLKGALVGGISAGLFYGIGTHFDKLADSAGVLSTGARVGKVAAHAMAGGISSVMNGGKFGHGFVSAGFTQTFSGVIDKIGGRIVNSRYFNFANRAMRIVASAVVGGTASSITGGKFANGAITGAFSRGFNDESHFNQVKQRVYNPATGKYEEMYRGMQPYRDSEGRLLLAADLSIVQVSSESKLDMLMYGDDAKLLQCQAMVACKGEWSSLAPTTNLSKPHLSSTSSIMKIKLMGNGWYMVSSGMVAATLEAGNYYRHVFQCSSNPQVVAKCGG
jgi:RHS repeat-associated protein